MNEGLKMTFREKLADWISGGALSFANNGWKRSIALGAELQSRVCGKDYVLDDLCDRLDRIAAEEKPTSNATVKRMARIARGQE